MIIESRDHALLGVLAFLPLLRAVQVLRPRVAAVAGALWGGSLFAFESVSPAGVIAPTFAALALLVLVPMCYAACGAWATRRAGFSPFVLAVGWILVECALQPLVPSRGVAAATQSPTLLAAVGGVLGYAWVSFLVVYLGAWVLFLGARVRLALFKLQLRLGIDDAGSWLWLPVCTPRPCYVRRGAGPRAPPARP